LLYFVDGQVLFCIGDATFGRETWMEKMFGQFFFSQLFADAGMQQVTLHQVGPKSKHL
jgi:hypothetical protein